MLSPSFSPAFARCHLLPSLSVSLFLPRISSHCSISLVPVRGARTQRRKILTGALVTTSRNLSLCFLFSPPSLPPPFSRPCLFSPCLRVSAFLRLCLRLPCCACMCLSHVSSLPLPLPLALAAYRIRLFFPFFVSFLVPLKL